MSLLEEAKSGNKIAYKELTGDIKIKLYKTARLYFKQEPEVLKAVKYTLKLLYKDIKNVKEEEKLIFFAISILLKYSNEKIMEYSKSKKWKKKYDTEEYEIEYQLYRRDSILEQYITSMNPSRRLIAVLYYYDELSIKDISKLLKNSEKDIESAIELARKELMELIINEGVKKYNDYV